MANRSNVGAIIAGTVATAGVVGIVGWWWYVYMAEAEAKGAKKKEPGQPAGQPASLVATPVVDEDTADQVAVELAEEPGQPGHPTSLHGVPTVTLGGG